jgi:sugar O-acyltransferase (sialic acid O-acetyltransferase NeuD family)
MPKPIIVFGTGKIAEVIAYYALEECNFNIAACCTDEKYLDKEEFLGIKVFPFEIIEQTFSPKEYDMFIALGYHDLNNLRAQKFKEAELKGYDLISIVSPNCHLPKNVKYGKNCFIMPPSIIHPCVNLGDNVFVWSGALVGHHSTIEDNCWITSNANLGGNVKLGENTFVAINATISHSVSIGKNCFVGSNCQVIKSMEEEQVVISEGSKPIKLNSKQFLKFSSFNSI